MADALNVLSVARMRRELQIGDTDTDHDVRIEATIRDAAGYVARQTGVPVVDTREVVEATPPADRDAPLMLEARDVSAIVSVTYWAPGAALNLVRSSQVDTGTLGRLDENGASTALWPPATGWPVVVEGTSFQITLTRSVDTVPDGLVGALIMVVRHVYEGRLELTRYSSVNEFLRPYVRLA